MCKVWQRGMDDCWAMGAMMDYDSQAVTGTTHLACVYCATYQAIADFLQPNWWKVLQIEVGNVALMFDSTKSTNRQIHQEFCFHHMHVCNHSVVHLEQLHVHTALTVAVL